MAPNRELNAANAGASPGNGEYSAGSGRRGYNWVHPALTEESTPAMGISARTSQDLNQGTLLVELDPSLQHFPYQVEDDLFLGPRDESEIGVGERLNHSCSPNAGFQRAIHVVALRDIRAGESITIDYATCVSADHNAFVMECKCGEQNCRGVITGEDWKLQEIQNRLYPYFQPYLQRKIRMRNIADNDDKLLDVGSKGSNVDTARMREPLAERSWSSVARFAKSVAFFCKSAFRHDWGAIVVSCLAALPSNILTCVLVVWSAKWLATKPLFSSQAAYVSAVSLLTGFIGYATYLLMYYGGMVFKERGDLWVNGVVSIDQVKMKLRIIACDFVMHLPSDFFALPLMGAGQGGLYAMGVSQFWSIFWAQAISDAVYAVKEPLFWHGAKKVALSLSSPRPKHPHSRRSRDAVSCDTRATSMSVKRG